MPKSLLTVLLASVLGLTVGCEVPDEEPPPPRTEAPELSPETAIRPGSPPEETLSVFLDALREQDVDQASNLTTTAGLDWDEQQLQNDLRRTSEAMAHMDEPAAILDIEEEGQHAIAAVRFPPIEPENAEPVIRPIVMTHETGEWKVVWELLGMEPERAREMSSLAQRIQPLYDWYSMRERELEREIVAGGHDEPAG